MKANHNNILRIIYLSEVVCYTTKLVKWKQITTQQLANSILGSCLLYYKVSKMKANHNKPFTYKINT